jgi:DNA (cytosine-5)-methyltransferase 1
MRVLDGNTVFTSISTFSGGGVGDLGVEWGQNLPVLSACELEPERAAIIRHNYPDTRVFVGDIWDRKDEIIRDAQSRLQGKHPWLFVASPPCQGMSANSKGRISQAIRNGTRSPEDARNRLILPSLEIIEGLLPDWIIVENVPGMENTIIRNEHDEPENILDTMARRLRPKGYTLRSAVLDFARLGVPHRRKRMITIGTCLPEFRDTLHEDPIFSALPTLLSIFSNRPTDFHPPYTHRKPVTLRQSIGHLPWLDAQSRPVDPDDPFHCVPVWNDMQYHAMKHTPEGETAYDNNTCLHCHTLNQTPDAVCRGCGNTLPKPLVTTTVWACTACGSSNESGEQRCGCGLKRTGDCPTTTTHRLTKTFYNCYKRMHWDREAPTITMNSAVISSANKGHPDQHRVLSIRELLVVSSIESHPNTAYPWDGKYQFQMQPEDLSQPPEPCTNRTIREIIGESIPPLAMAAIVRHLISLDKRLQTDPQHK